MHPMLLRARHWLSLQAASDHVHAWLRAVLLGATCIVLVVPLLNRQHHAPRPVVRPPVAAAPQIKRELDLGKEPASADLRTLAQWIVSTANNGAMNFAILDKKNAKVFVFEPGGKLVQASPVLLGYAKGDDSVAGIGKRPIDEVRPSERTTPAGRFVAEPGRNALHEDVVWIDYDAAVSMHRVRLTHPAEHRAERLRSANVQARRISYGCINLPPSFFEQVVWPKFRQHGGVFYVLPEVKKLEAVFPEVGRSGSGGKSAPVITASTS
ncbi:hypothetical protein ACFJGW_19985 [Burkholderiaceae bacterium UC74_6]